MNNFVVTVLFPVIICVCIRKVMSYETTTFLLSFYNIVVYFFIILHKSLIKSRLIQLSYFFTHQLFTNTNVDVVSLCSGDDIWFNFYNITLYTYTVVFYHRTKSTTSDNVIKCMTHVVFVCAHIIIIYVIKTHSFRIIGKNFVRALCWVIQNFWQKNRF